MSDLASVRRLDLADVSASYGGPDTIRNISLHVARSEVVALLGPNGAGKTTLLNAISGTVRVTKGSISVDGRIIDRLKVHRIVAEGIAHVPQGRDLFGYSTGLENLRLGGYTRTSRQELQRDISNFAREWPVAQRVMNRIGYLMSGGEQQVVAIGRALMSRPKVLLLDEPSSGLAPILVDQLFGMVRTLVSQLAQENGLAVLLVEQNVRKALQIADRVYILVSGEIRQVSEAKGTRPEAVVEVFLGKRSLDGS